MTATESDIIIVGAGIAGSSLAAELANTHRVLLLEREDFPGYHSTGRSAALFSEIYGNAAVRALSRASRSFFYSPPSGFTSSVLVSPRGSLYIARADQITELEEFAATEDVGGAIRSISAPEAIAACPILRPEYVSAALFEINAADVDVDALHQGYLRAFHNLGGTLVTNAEVESLDKFADGLTVGAGKEMYRAPVVVNAAGACGPRCHQGRRHSPWHTTLPPHCRSCGTPSRYVGGFVAHGHRY